MRPTAGVPPIFVAAGFIAIPTARAYTLSVISDNGSGLVIGGTWIVSSLHQHGMNTWSNDVTFTGVGLYSFHLDQFENQGATGVNVKMDSNPLVTSTLYSVADVAVPKPVSLSVLGAGLAAARMPHRRHRPA
jgi:hypothetical protein